MALWVDKYRPRVLEDLDYHKQQAEQLKNLAEQSDFPHLMFFGPSGAGKKHAYYVCFVNCTATASNTSKMKHFNLRLHRIKKWKF